MSTKNSVLSKYVNFSLLNHAQHFQTVSHTKWRKPFLNGPALWWEGMKDVAQYNNIEYRVIIGTISSIPNFIDVPY